MSAERSNKNRVTQHFILCFQLKDKIPCCNMTRTDVKQYVNCPKYNLKMTQNRGKMSELDKDGTIHGKV